MKPFIKEEHEVGITFKVKMWETEEYRDIGESDTVYFDLTDLHDAKHKAQKLIFNGIAVSVEVISEDEDGGETVYWGTDGDEEWSDFE